MTNNRYTPVLGEIARNVNKGCAYIHFELYQCNYVNEIKSFRQTAIKKKRADAYYRKLIIECFFLTKLNK